jgi:hypothetical protein
MKWRKLTNVDFLILGECFVNPKVYKYSNRANDYGLRIGNVESWPAPISFFDAA